MAESRRFLVLHGWTNRRPPEHWQWQLTEQLRRAGEQVTYPQLPDPDTPSLATWTELLHAELAMLGDGERVVVAHSLSTLLWLSAAAGITAQERVSRVLLVAPPSRALLARYPEVAEFTQARFGQDAVLAASGTTRVVCTDDDEWCPEGFAAAFPELALDTDLIPGGGHLNTDAGYGTWPSMLAWCRDPSVRLVARDFPPA